MGVGKSEKFDTVKAYYDDKLWNLGRVKKAVGRWITPEEYEKITGYKFE